MLINIRWLDVNFGLVLTTKLALSLNIASEHSSLGLDVEELGYCV